MNSSLFFSMCTFAFAASVTPGPVNLICLSSGTQHGVARGLQFVSGATVGFVALFISVGFGLFVFLNAMPNFETILRWSGVAFLLYLSVSLIRSDGSIGTQHNSEAPGFFSGAAMQWLNPKAWLASVSGISAYASGGDIELTLIFAALYFPICWLSLSVWVLAGNSLSKYLHEARYVRWFNRAIAGLLLMSCAVLFTG